MKKEFRALLPMWALSVAIVAAAGVGFPQLTVARMALGLSLTTLSAMSIGHEYLYGTLPGLLTLPLTRRRILANKIVALAPMLTTLALLAIVVMPAEPRFNRNTSFPQLSLLFAVVSAPFFTMLCRGPLGGVVFAFGFAGGMQLLGETSWHRWTLIAGSVLAVFSGWQLFMRLEVIESVSASFDLPHWSKTAPHEGAPYDPRSRAWLLVAKELRLQQMAFVTAASYLLLWAVVMIVWRANIEARGVLAVVGLTAGGLIALLVGALAGAEERHMRTLEWHLLLPLAGWKQWTVKVLVVTVVALALGFVMPIVTATGAVGWAMTPAVGVVVLAVGSLYIATLCESSIGAVVIASPVMFVVISLGLAYFAPAILSGVRREPFDIGGILLVGLALRFGFDNYVTTGRDFKRVAWQLAWMASVVAVVGSMYWAGRVRY